MCLIFEAYYLLLCAIMCKKLLYLKKILDRETEKEKKTEKKSVKNRIV